MISQKISQKAALTVVAAIVLCAALTGSARAPDIDLGEVWTTDTSNNPKDTFPVGETVRIHWKDFKSAVVIVVLFENKIVAVRFDVSGTGHKDYLPDQGVGRYWVVVADVVLATFGVTSFFVVPEFEESSLGSVVMLAASLGALAESTRLKRLRKTR